VHNFVVKVKQTSNNHTWRNILKLCYVEELTMDY